MGAAVGLDAGKPAAAQQPSPLQLRLPEGERVSSGVPSRLNPIDLVRVDASTHSTSHDHASLIAAPSCLVTCAAVLARHTGASCTNET